MNSIDKPNLTGIKVRIETGIMEDDQAFLELGYNSEPKDNAGLSIQIRINSLDDVMKKIKSNIKFSEPVVRPWSSKYLYLLDPSGVTVILYEGKL